MLSWKKYTVKPSKNIFNSFLCKSVEVLIYGLQELHLIDEFGDMNLQYIVVVLIKIKKFRDYV